MLNQTKVLVIDDDQIIGRTLKNVLSVHGYDVCFTENGATGIEKAFEYNPDLILCDVRMEPIDGYKVLNILKQNSFIYRIPFIFLSGDSDVNDVRLGMDLGADDFLVKPFNIEDLLLSIENQINKYKFLLDLGRRQFNALLEISPNYIFLFDGYTLFGANTAFVRFFNVDLSKISFYNVEEFLDDGSFEKIKNKLQRCNSGVCDKFKERVKIVSKDNSIREMDLYITQYDKHTGFSLLLGLLIPVENTLNLYDPDDLLKEIISALKCENMIISDLLSRKLSGILNSRVNFVNKEVNINFSKREIQVLRLAMRGLPIKQIADKLLISIRTVERHRASLMGKTNSKNMIEVIVFAISRNLIKV